MGILQWSLGNQCRFVGTNTVFWATIVAIVLLGRKILTGGFGSPDFVAVMIILPFGTFVGSIVMWNLFFKSNPYREEKRK